MDDVIVAAVNVLRVKHQVSFTSVYQPLNGDTVVCQLMAFLSYRCNNPMEIDLVILVAKGEALHDQSSVQEIDDLSKQKRHVKSGEVLRHAGSTNFV
ncbi:hypothetical protein J6590_094403 [Homalodisca vitripennis]|nr:hypothetical protein J6590_094403 [Homalodisca vitripennis]